MSGQDFTESRQPDIDRGIKDLEEGHVNVSAYALMAQMIRIDERVSYFIKAVERTDQEIKAASGIGATLEKRVSKVENQMGIGVAAMSLFALVATIYVPWALNRASQDPKPDPQVGFNTKEIEDVKEELQTLHNSLRRYAGQDDTDPRESRP